MTHLGAEGKKKNTDKIGGMMIIVIIFKNPEKKKTRHQILLWKCHPSLPSVTVIFL